MTSTLASLPGRSASRARPVERMVKRGQLERGPSSAPATVSKRSLLAALEQRRRDDSHLTQAAEIEQGGSGTGWFSRDSAPGPEVSAARGPSWRRCSTSSWPYKLRARGRRRRDRRRRAASARSPTPNATASSAPTRAQRRRAAAVTRAARPGAKPTANTSTPPAAPAGSDFSHREIAAAAGLPYPGQRAFRSSAHVDAGPLGGYRDLFTGRGIVTRARLARRLTRTVTWITPPIRTFSALLSSSRTTS